MIERVSRKYDQLKDAMKSIVRNRAQARIDPALMRWIAHLLQLKMLAAASPGISDCLTYDEIRGLGILEEVIRESERDSRTCPRCKAKTSALFNCDQCGMGLR